MIVVLCCVLSISIICRLLNIFVDFFFFFLVHLIVLCIFFFCPNSREKAFTHYIRVEFSQQCNDMPWVYKEMDY